MSGERWDEIARWVDADGRVGLGDLASRFGVSEMTIRRDLDALTAAGRLRRVRGGAVSLTSAPPSSSSPAQPGRATPPLTRPAGTGPGVAPGAVASTVGAAGSTAWEGGAAVTDPRGGLRVDGPTATRPDPRGGGRGDVPGAGEPTSDLEGLPSPGFDLSRAPSSLGSVIASWAGALPTGFPSTSPGPHSGSTGTPGDQGAGDPSAQERPTEATVTGYPTAAHASSGEPRSAPREPEAPPGWDLPPADHPGGHAAPPTPAPSAQAAPSAALEDPWARAAHAALSDLTPGAAVLLTGGTGCLALAHHVARLASRSPATPLTVAVTALAPATVLAGAPGVRLVVLGGEAEPAGTDLVGPSALAALEDLHLDVAVLTPTGLDARGAWAPTSAAAALVAAAVARAERTVAVVAPGALGRPGLVRAAPLGALDQVVAVPAPGEDSASLTARLEAVRATAPSAPRISAA
ncbi:DeoR family transcriptional regulator [Quadrisphaera setariae]|uniref:DeoR family transcriptional regulator n=1 Tax=Quadrisphaera setariae TaxID=2593304 RepID=A0A5C8ZGI0_9ACTN|nr:DeoR family transcriptional regulator [Quadrisphaera setariae]